MKVHYGIRAYLVLQTDSDKPQEIIGDLFNKPGTVTVDLLEGSPNLLVESITGDLRFFIGRESHISVLAEATV
jgi:hypothetical protein